MKNESRKNKTIIEVLNLQNLESQFGALGFEIWIEKSEISNL